MCDIRSMETFDERDAVEWLRQKLEESGTSHADLGRAWGKDGVDDPGNYVTKTIKGTRKLTLDEFFKSKLFFGEQVVDAPIEVRGKVGAGGHVYGVDSGPLDIVPNDERYPASTTGLEVSGDSMGNAFPDGSLVFYDQVYDYPEPIHINKNCVVWCADGRTMIKRLLKGSRPDRWSLFSITGSSVEEDVFLDHVALITGVRFR